MTILIADDSSLLRTRIKNLLQSTCCAVRIHEASNGIEALSIIRNEKPDIALIDIRMPQMNGIEVLQKAREYETLTKLCVFTNYPYKQYKDRCLSAGVDYFFDKNQDIQLMLDIITEMANEKK